MESLKTLFSFRDVPFGWAICMNRECERRSECMRYLVGERAPEHVNAGPAVYPGAWSGAECSQYHPVRIDRMAVGFGDIFQDVRARHSAMMRQHLEKYLGGHGSYYRYKNGERMLSESQQEWIRQLFERFGYDGNVAFNDYVEQYVFD